MLVEATTLGPLVTRTREPQHEQQRDLLQVEG